jgi:hypothetical protein
MKFRHTFIVFALSGIGFAFAAEPKPVSIFNGQDLTGWTGNPHMWSVENGAITGRSTVEHAVEVNTFLVYEAPVKNFELRAKFKLEGESANSGIQYRSRYLDAAIWSVGGYQADMDVTNRYTGMLYEEKGRGIVVRPGQRIRIGPLQDDGKPQLDSIGDPTDPAVLKVAIRAGEWNEIVIIAEGNRHRHYVNGVLTAEAYDTDPTKSKSTGLLALQLHRGPPMVAQFKDIFLTVLP